MTALIVIETGLTMQSGSSMVYAGTLARLVQADVRVPVTLCFLGDYQAGQEVGVEVEDEVYLYTVSVRDVGVDAQETRANVARGVLIALINGGFNAFPAGMPVLAANTLTLMASPAARAHLRHTDPLLARNLWCN